MVLPFANRAAAAARLGHRLAQYRGRDDTTIIALPRGGIPVAARIAADLDLPVDTLVVEKVRLDPNRVIGAVTSGGVELSVNAAGTGFTPANVIAREAALSELARKSACYRPSPGPSLKGWRVIIVDDGSDSGLTMVAAATAARQKGAERIIAAVPVVSPQAATLLRAECDELVCLAMPKPFNSLAECYLDFTLLSDEVCTDILRSVDRNHACHD